MLRRLLIILFLIGGVLSQSCVFYDRSLLVEPCQSFNPSNLAYLESGESLEEAINMTNNFVTGILLLAARAPTCGPWLTWFCQNPNLLNPTQKPLYNCPVSEPFKSPPPSPMRAVPCLDFCQNLYAGCKPALDFLNLGNLMPPTFCDAYTNSPLILGNEIFPCWNVTPASPPPFNTSCVEPYTHSNGEANQQCLPICPSPEYDQDQIFEMGLMQQIVGWISIVLASLLAIPFLVLPSLRRFPIRIVLFLVIASCPLSLAFILATFTGGNVGNVWCGDVEYYPRRLLSPDESDRLINDEGLCVFQAWNIVFGTLCLAFWWCAWSLSLTATVWKSLHLDTTALSQTVEVIMHVVCWGIPLVLTIIPTAAGQMGYQTSYSYCFISSNDNNGWIIACWFVPMGIALVIGSVATFATLVLLLKCLLGGIMGDISPLISLVCRKFVLLVIILVCFSLIYASQIYNSSNLSENQLATFAYLFCLLTPGNSEAFCRHTLYDTTSLQTMYNLSMASTFFMACQGIFICLFFLTAQNLLRQVKSGISDITKTMTQRSATSPSHASPSHAVSREQV